MACLGHEACGLIIRVVCAAGGGRQLGDGEGAPQEACKQRALGASEHVQPPEALALSEEAGEGDALQRDGEYEHLDRRELEGGGVGVEWRLREPVRDEERVQGGECHRQLEQLDSLAHAWAVHGHAGRAGHPELGRWTSNGPKRVEADGPAQQHHEARGWALALAARQTWATGKAAAHWRRRPEVNLRLLDEDVVDAVEETEENIEKEAEVVEEAVAVPEDEELAEEDKAAAKDEVIADEDKMALGP